MSSVTIFGCVGRWGAPIPPGEVWYPNFRPPAPILKRLTRSFQMHPWATMVRTERAWLRTCPTTIYTVEDLSAKNPRATRYPLHRSKQNLWTSSFDYMLAMAIEEEFPLIRLRALSLQMGSLRERVCEHVGLAYWVGRARGQGLTVDIGKECLVLQYPYHYGFDYWEERRWGQQMGRAARAAKRLDDGQARANRSIKGVRFNGKV